MHSQDRVVRYGEERSGATMSFVFHLSSVLPQANYGKNKVLALYNKFNPDYHAIIPHNLGRITHITKVKEIEVYSAI